MEGNVKWLSRKKGYGFIEGDDGQEYFVHHSGLTQGTFIRDNDRVSFNPTDGEKGNQAQNITLLQKGSERTDLPAKEESQEAPVEEEETNESAEEETDEPVEDED